MCLYFLEQLGSGHSSRAGEAGGEEGARRLPAGDSSSVTRAFLLPTGAGGAGEGAGDGEALVEGGGEGASLGGPELLAPAPAAPPRPRPLAPPFLSLL